MDVQAHKQHSLLQCLFSRRPNTHLNALPHGTHTCTKINIVYVVTSVVNVNVHFTFGIGVRSLDGYTSIVHCTIFSKMRSSSMLDGNADTNRNRMRPLFSTFGIPELWRESKNCFAAKTVRRPTFSSGAFCAKCTRYRVVGCVHKDAIIK